MSTNSTKKKYKNKTKKGMKANRENYYHLPGVERKTKQNVQNNHHIVNTHRVYNTMMDLM